MEKRDYCEIPMDLIDNPIYAHLDGATVILYARMMDKANISVDNPDNSINNAIIYPIKQVMADMRCSKQKAVNMVEQLEKCGLIKKERKGQGNPSIIYVNAFILEDY